MASTALGPSQAEVATLTRITQTPAISKPILQSICVINGLLKSGNKADLQKRIIKLIDDCAQAQDYHRFLEVRKSIYDNAPIHVIQTNDRAHTQPTYPPIQSVPGPSTASAYVNSMAPGSAYAGNGYGAASVAPRPLPIQQSFQYKYSPFYEMRLRLGELKICDAMPSHRNTVNVMVRVQDHVILQQCANDPSMRVMVFCAAANTGAQDICFPYQSELKVNSGEVKANLRGLKNKPGSTKPVDITDLLRLKPTTYSNNVEFTYALTSKAGGRSELAFIDKSKHKFYFGVYVCKVTPLETLVKQLALGKKIAKPSVIQELRQNASDPDIVTTSQNISLKCPLSYMRLKDPARGLRCKHVQCFDVTSYLQLQEQGPQWMCPICNNQCLFDHLAIDEYVKDILTNTSSSVEQVTIEPDGSWHIPVSKTEERKPSAAPRDASFIGDDDLMIAQTNAPTNSSRATATPNRFFGASATGSSIAGSRETSLMPGSATSRSGAGTKRPAPETIDLTLSEDDEPPSRPAKRQHVANDNVPTWANDYSY